MIESIAAGLRLAIFFGCSGAIFALAVIGVCRWLKWAPVNITFNVSTDHPIEGRYDDVGDAPGAETQHRGAPKV